MGEFVAVLLSFPTVLFTAPLGVAILYWLFVVVGALDLDLLDGAHGHGDADGLLDGGDGADLLHADGNADVLHGGDGAGDVGHLSADGAPHGGDADVLDAADAADVPLVSTMLSALRLTRVPLTVSLSFVILFAWLTSFLLQVHVLPRLALPALLLGPLSALASLVVGTLGASLAVRPLSRAFHTERGRGNRSFVGDVVTISTSSVSAKHGQADLASDGHHLLVQVRDPRDQGLRKGDRALLVQWDSAAGVFVVERLDLAASGGDERAAYGEALDRARARLREGSA